MKVILFGATGMVGQGVLRECLLDPVVEAVLVVGRTPVEQRDPKLREVVHVNLFDLSSIEGEFAGLDACFFCLGVSSAGMSEEAYRRVTYDLTMSAAQAMVQQNPDKMQTKSDDDGSQAGCSCGSSVAPGPQMKLSVSQPGDQYEQEADRVANAVMHQEQQGSSGSSHTQSIHRQMPEEEEEMMQAKYRDDQIRRQMEE